MKIQRISLGFPLNIIVETSIENIDEIKKNDYSNKNVDIRVKIDKVMKKSFNKESLESEIKLATNANKVRLQFVYDTQTNVRSKEISEQKDITDKFIAYAKLNGITYKDSLLDKIRNIQEYMFTESFTPHDSFVLEYISIRGSIGLLDGQGREEMSFNFADDFSDGIIGIIGPSGSGKTVILENMHPYPCLLTRVGSLKDHFCLPDSHRILIYRCSSGKKIRISMFINGSAKSVMTRYFVEIKEEGKSWETLKSIDGSNESYLQWVNSTFGPKELFMRTSFYPKETPKNFPDLSQATKSEKMELFSVLSGTDYLSVVSEQAKLKLKDEEKLVEDIKTQMKDFDDIEDKMTRYSDIISNNDIQIKEYEKYIETDRASLDEYTEKQKAFIAASATYDIFRNQLTEKLNRQVELQKSIIQIENNIIGLNQQIEDIDTYKAQIEWYDENISKRKELQKQDSELRDKLNTLQAHIDKKQAEIDSHKENYRDLDNKVKDVVKDISMLEKSIPETDGTCPVCGAPLSDHKKEELEKEIETINAKIEEYKKERDEYQTQRDEEIKWLDNNSIQNFKTEQTDTNNKLVEIVNDISTIDSYMESMDIDELRNIVNNSDNNLAAENNRKQETQKELDSVNKTIDELNEKLNNIPEDYSDKITRLQRGIEDSQQNIATLKAEVTMAKTEMEKFKESESKIKSIKEEVKVHTNNIKEYEIIQQAFSNNGIQALELDSAAPEISDIANAILLETYGDRFSISFDTQRDARDGRKIDDFIINVFDAKCGRNKRLDLISSGEGALIKQTLYYAFSVIRTRRTGFCFRTRFLDESDGSLDSALRVKYLRMIEAAHKQCGAVQSFLITHSQELKEIIEQKIEL